MRVSLVNYGLLFFLGLCGLQACEITVPLPKGEGSSFNEGRTRQDGGHSDAPSESSASEPAAEPRPEGMPESPHEGKPEPLPEGMPESPHEATDVCPSCTQLLTKVCPGLSLAEGEIIEGIKGATVLLRGKTGFERFDLDTCTRATIVGPSLAASLYDVGPENFLFGESETQPEPKTTFFWLRGTSLTRKEFLGWSLPLSGSYVTQERGIIRLEQSERFLYVFFDASQQRLDGWETTRDVTLYPVIQGATHDVYYSTFYSSSGKDLLAWDVKNARISNQGVFEGWTAALQQITLQGLLALDYQVAEDKLQTDVYLWPFQPQKTAQKLLSLSNVPRFLYPILLADGTDVLLLADTKAYHISLVTGAVVSFDLSFLGVPFNAYAQSKPHFHFSKGSLFFVKDNDLVKLTFQPEKGGFSHHVLSLLPARPGSLLEVVGSDQGGSPIDLPPGTPPRFWLLRRTWKDSPTAELIAFDLRTERWTPWLEGPFTKPPVHSRIPEGWRFYPQSLSYYVNPTGADSQRVSVRLDTGRRFFSSSERSPILQMAPPRYLQRIEIITASYPVASTPSSILDHKCFKTAAYTAPSPKVGFFASDRYIAVLEGDASTPRLALYKVCPSCCETSVFWIRGKTSVPVIPRLSGTTEPQERWG